MHEPGNGFGDQAGSHPISGSLGARVRGLTVALHGERAVRGLHQKHQVSRREMAGAEASVQELVALDQADPDQAAQDFLDAGPALQQGPRVVSGAGHLAGLV